MRHENIAKYLCFSLLLALGFSSCSKMDATYKKFTKEGPLVYAPKVDSIKAFSGKNRILLSGLVSSEITKVAVYWNNGSDSLVKSLHFKPEGMDTLRLSIEHLKARNYFFKIYSCNKYGDRSVPVQVKGRSYGDGYQKLLVNRSLNSMQQSVLGFGGIIDWGSARTGEAGIELSYINNKGKTLSIIVPDSITHTVLPGYKPGTVVSYRSMYLPDTTAIDTFFCPYKYVIIPKPKPELLNSANFSAVHLSGDYPICCGWLISHIWDGIIGNEGYASATDQFPGGSNYHPGSGYVFKGDYRFTFDLGIKSKLSSYKLWPRSGHFYGVACPKVWQLWGRTTPPDPDGSYNGWTKLVRDTMIKPSGLPYGQISQADITAADTGFLFTFPANTPPVRYIRFQLVGLNWSGDHNTQISEMKFWGIPIQ